MSATETKGRRLTPQRLVTFALLLGLTLWVLHDARTRAAAAQLVPYSELLEAAQDGRVARLVVHPGSFEAELVADGAAEDRGEREHVRAQRLPGLEERALLDALAGRPVELVGEDDGQGAWWPMLLMWLLPMGLFFGYLAWSVRRVGRGGGASALSVGKAGVRIFDASRDRKVTFADVAGVDEAKTELAEIVAFLRHPERFAGVGALMPKGVLLLGPPGTGKTLLARAVAGEAGVPFFSISGSAFVEMFVGVGAARMRDLFDKARERAPCIVFIDEIDAVGRSRGGVGAMATHDEREQTLNQLLTEMDGFAPNSGVIIMAATNRHEILDPALLRAGRFDRQVLVDRPDVTGREAILRIHARRLRLDEDVALEVVARRTPGMAGADLANVVNEAALAAVRRGADRVAQRDFEEAIDRIQLGLKKGASPMTEAEKRRVAIHEAGHALVALSVPNADPVHRVSILPRGLGALGVTLQLPTHDRQLLTRSELDDRLAVLMGGRAAEELVCHEASTGAQNDLVQATETARAMVLQLGLSEAIGPVTYERRPESSWLAGSSRAETSEETARLIDAEIRRILDEAYGRALRVLEVRRDHLEAVADALCEHETLDAAALQQLLARRPRVVRRAGAT